MAVLAPISFTIMLNQKIHWSLNVSAGVILGIIALALHSVRHNIGEKLMKKYENLEVGDVLSKKVAPSSPRHFVVTNRGYNHFYLKCLNTGEQVLVSKHRVREDFDIAN